jgi:sulfite exporter TauE/SafE
VLSGPDHLAAVALFSADGRKAWKAGLFWGTGHSAAVGLFGVLAFLSRDLLPLGFLHRWSEPFVGVVLVGLGLFGLARAWRKRTELKQSAFHARSDAPPVTSFLTGLVHGIAGGTHFLGVLPALALPSRLAAFDYVFAFSLGTVAAMIGFAAAMGLISHRAASVSPRAGWRVSAAFSMIALLVGGYWIAFS